MKPKLEPCPFCGVIPEPIFYSRAYKDRFHRIRHSNYDCILGECSLCDSTSAEEAAEKWNKRFKP